MLVAHPARLLCIASLPRSRLALSNDGPPRAFIRTFSMDNQSAAPQPDTISPSDGIDEDKGVGRLSGGIVPHILNMYNCTSTALDYDIYAPDGTFEDPLMCAHGVKQIKSAFYSIPKVFREAKIGEYTVREHETSPGSGEINIDNVQHYKLLGKQIDMVSLIKLQVKDGKVVRHEDWWDKKPLWNRDTVKVPLVGRFLETARRGNMLLTHVLMGCGKDPRPKQT